MELTQHDINCIVAFFMLFGYMAIIGVIGGIIWMAIPRRKQRAILAYIDNLDKY